MISLDTLVAALIYLVVAGLIFWLLWWLVGYLNPPEPFEKVANVILAVAAVLVCVAVLLTLVSGHPVFLRP